jgi:hypothetical protein
MTKPTEYPSQIPTHTPQRVLVLISQIQDSHLKILSFCRPPTTKFGFLAEKGPITSKRIPGGNREITSTGD